MPSQSELLQPYHNAPAVGLAEPQSSTILPTLLSDPIQGSAEVFQSSSSSSFVTSSSNSILATDTPPAIRGMMWDDRNGNGVQDSGELGLAGWTIYLDQNLNGQLDVGETSTTTDASG